ncbi:LytR/AlgR family response regulator transcription factor [Cecembia calidifontis]|uniref:DNA-binding LytR/AlgR family response regulator n=1 Tax=Cecembia calidifontis TaxID=1187080 RepID=A0A4V2F627_9BACT|nr:response regulator transcription factor [Cecembia calidifontis]RZS94859.1 DNA-binding LytR/AlgR family response regulator [Cecembia calidifontis]
MNTKLKCLLLDDELPGLTYLKMLCEQLPELEVVKAFNDPEIFLKEVPNLEFDFCILDIEMPYMNGLQIANLLAGKPVIFATAYKEFAAEAFDLNAADYIRKPIKLERLRQGIEKVSQILGKSASVPERKFFQANTNKGKAVLFFEKIAYIRTSEVDSRDKVVTLVDGEEIVLKNVTFGKLLDSLPKKEFCRINKKEMLSLKAVQVFSFDEVITNLIDKNGKNLRLSLSENYRTEFIQKINI